MRLSQRRTRPWNESYLAYRSMWKNIESAARLALADLPVQPLVLDIGCGNKPYSDLFVDCRHIGLNPGTDDASPDVVGDAMSLPFTSGSVDLVFCTQVLEHVPHPPRLFEECSRVLSPGGWLILSAPFYWPLHEEPHDYFRFTHHGLLRMATDAGLEVQSCKADGGDGSRLVVSILHALPWLLRAPLRVPLHLAGLLLDRLGRKPPRLPLNYTLLARPSTRRQGS